MSLARVILPALACGLPLCFAEDVPWRQTDFPAQEFVARREKVFAKIGNEAAAATRRPFTCLHATRDSKQPKARCSRPRMPNLPGGLPAWRGLSAGHGGIRAAIKFDAGRDAGVAGQRPAPRSVLEPQRNGTSVVQSPCSIPQADGIGPETGRRPARLAQFNRQ